VSAIPSQAAASAAHARLFTRKHSTTELAEARELVIAARLKRLILANLGDEPLTVEHRDELADLIQSGGAK
jgi:hypothetical protein